MPIVGAPGESPWASLFLSKIEVGPRTEAPGRVHLFHCLGTLQLLSNPVGYLADVGAPGQRPWASLTLGKIERDTRRFANWPIG